MVVKILMIKPVGMLYKFNCYTRAQMGSIVRDLATAFKAKGYTFILAIPPPVYQVGCPQSKTSECFKVLTQKWC